MMERFFGKRTDIDLGGSERIYGIATFSKEQKSGLARLGYEYFYPLTAQSIKDLQDTCNLFWSTGDNNKSDAFKKIASMGTEIALNPRTLFLANSNSKGLSEQLAMITEFSKALGKEVPGVKAVMGEASDYSALAFAHQRATGKRLFSSDYTYEYARTKTSTSDSDVAVVGRFYGFGGLAVHHLARDDGDVSIWAAPLVVPQEAR